MKPIPKSKKEIIKGMKHIYKVARKVYNSIYSSIAEHFKIYLEPLASDKIDEIENVFRENEESFFS